MCTSSRLNPYSNGLPVLGGKAGWGKAGWGKVLIPILMDYPFWETDAAREAFAKIVLIPILMDYPFWGARRRFKNERLARLNPYSNGLPVLGV